MEKEIYAERSRGSSKVYTPLIEKDSTFHRTLFLFMCTSLACLLKDQHEPWKRNQDKASRSVKVFRSNCPVITLFPPVSPREITGKINLLVLELFFVAGVVPGKEIRSQKTLLTLEHFQDASEPSNNRTVSEVQEEIHGDFNPRAVASKSLWPEYEIAIAKISDDNGQVNSLISSSRVDESIESLIDSFEEGEDDKKSWASFQERVLPQILYYFGVENDVHSLDWATIAVYTCESSCDKESLLGFKLHLNQVLEIY
ncbi:hypothetical protein RND71_016038 [Anisodus tanguticus]|uniref:Programmed cell death protein 2 C-terminal domain-containing protein n=1 Tax=Anisodus tanguticus TaxID=243964 RepID=A0AAE1S711_9SOLA|nr:hypothetical protein RND71_016038 [Anisodus tanguticus]